MKWNKIDLTHTSSLYTDNDREYYVTGKMNENEQSMKHVEQSMWGAVG